MGTDSRDAEVDEVADFRQQVREFIVLHQPDVPPRAGTRSADNEREVAELRRWNADLYNAGYIGNDWPVEFGGSAAPDPGQSIVVAEEIARARAPQPFSGATLVSRALIDFGTAEQQSRYLPAIRAASDHWCQLFSEPGAGSDLASMRTRAVPDTSGGWRVSGQKVWTTDGHWAHYGYLLARTDPDAPKHKGISAFVLDMRSPGVTVRPLREMTGTSDFNEVFFDEVELPADSIIGQPGQGWLIANSSLAHERAGVGAGVVRLQLAWEALVELAGRTDIDGTPAAADGGVREELGRFAAEVAACSALTRRSLAAWAAGHSGPVDAPMAKLMFSELNVDMQTFALNLMGQRGAIIEGDAATEDHGRWQDEWLYCRALTIAGGSSEIMRNVISERGLGLPRG